jgi:hypothetical protein
MPASMRLAVSIAHTRAAFFGGMVCRLLFFLPAGPQTVVDVKRKREMEEDASQFVPTEAGRQG